MRPPASVAAAAHAPSAPTAAPAVEAVADIADAFLPPPFEALSRRDRRLLTSASSSLNRVDVMDVFRLADAQRALSPDEWAPLAAMLPACDAGTSLSALLNREQFKEAAANFQVLHQNGAFDPAAVAAIPDNWRAFYRALMTDTDQARLVTEVMPRDVRPSSPSDDDDDDADDPDFEVNQKRHRRKRGKI